MSNKLIGKRIIVIGCSGSGKSTFAIRLSNMTRIPLFHLDNIWWKSDRTHISRDEFDIKLETIIRSESWIIDGDYSRTYKTRIIACDTILFLDYSRDVCLSGIEERVGKDRPDIPWTEETIDPELVDLINNFQSLQRPVLMSLFQKYPDKNLITFHSRQEADTWLGTLGK